MSNQNARFWLYTGNHPNGKNHERKDAHAFGLELISAMAYWGDGGDYPPPLTYADTKQVKVTHHKGDNFGHEVTVSAPSEIWERGRQAYQAYELLKF